MAVHACVDCRALPDGEQPLKARPAPHGGPRSRRCDTHWRAHRKATKAKRHDSRVQKVYGLEPGEYAALLAYQGGTCAIPGCQANGRRRRLAVDHDHDTGEIRGILCAPHNYELLGKFAGDLQAGLNYLNTPPARRWRASRLKEAG